MAQVFSGYPETKWVSNHQFEDDGDRNPNQDMTLLKEFYFIDKEDKKWTVPEGSYLNGATIPRALWSRIGSPFVGKYRRASVVHDYFVGEGPNPDVEIVIRKDADKMFYEACLFDNCSKSFAAVLFVGVCLGTWWAKRKTLLRNSKNRTDEDFKEFPEDRMIQAKFEEVITELEDSLGTMDFEELYSKVERYLIVKETNINL